LQVVLYALKVAHQDKDYFSLRDDIYDYLDKHWNKLCGKTRSPTWRQTAKMTLAHSRYNTIFENGYYVYLRTGYWRLKSSINPYIQPLEETEMTTHSFPVKRKATTQLIEASEESAPYNLRKRDDPPNYVETSEGSEEDNESEDESKKKRSSKKRKLNTPPSTLLPPKAIPQIPSQNTDQTTLKQCDNCKTMVTPQWRRGPNGTGTLCNSCGVKWYTGNRRKNQVSGAAKKDDGASSKAVMDHLEAIYDNSSSDTENIMKNADLPMEYIFRTPDPVFDFEDEEEDKKILLELLQKDSKDENKDEIVKLREENERLLAQLQDERAGRLKDKTVIFEKNREIYQLSQEHEQLLKRLRQMESLCENIESKSNEFDTKYQQACNEILQLRQLTTKSDVEISQRELLNRELIKKVASAENRFKTEQDKVGQYYRVIEAAKNKPDILLPPSLEGIISNPHPSTNRFYDFTRETNNS